MAISQYHEQTQAIFPQAVQAAQVLQMGIQELRDYIEQAVLENPVLELPEQTEPFPTDTGDPKELPWLEECDPQNICYHQQDYEEIAGDPLANLSRFSEEGEALDQYILSQFLGIRLEPSVMEAVRFLTEQLDEDGWFSEDLDALIARSGFPPAVIQRALMELQAAEPAGVGARDLPECLRLQIQRWAGDHDLEISIVDNCLPELARGNYEQIGRQLGASEHDVHTACDFIRGLNPKPATGFASKQEPAYLVPDVNVLRYADHLELSINPHAFPKLELSSYYLSLLKETDDESVRSYLAERTEQARRVVKCVRQRRDTLIRCMGYLTRRQAAFFLQGPDYLLPLSIEQAAEELGVPASTISRASKDKYFQCEWGIYPFSYLFSRSESAGKQEADATSNPS